MITVEFLKYLRACESGQVWFMENFPNGADLELMYSVIGDRSWFWGVILTGVPLDLLLWAFTAGVIPKPLWIDIDAFGMEETQETEYIMVCGDSYSRDYYNLKGNRDRWSKNYWVSDIPF